MSRTRWLYRLWDPLPADGDPVQWCGGKGASLRSLHAAGLPVPAGFTITTEACRKYFELGRRFPDDFWEQVIEAVADLEKETGQVFAVVPQPLLLAVRSGASISMPGMLLTLLHCGLTWDLSETLNEAGVWRAYGGLICGLASAQGVELLAINDANGAKDEREACARQLQEYERRRGQPFPQAPRELLRSCVAAVFDSWWNQRASAYRRLHQMDDSLATAVTVQTMVATEVAGVLFSRDPRNRDSDTLVIEAVRGLGDQLVAGRVEPERHVVERARVAALCKPEAPAKVPSLAIQACLDDTELDQLCRLGLRIEGLLGGAVDVEWGFARGQLVVFQARPVDDSRADQRLAQARLAEIERLDRCRRELGTRLWVPHNLGETLTAPTPLTWDLLSRFMSGRGGFGRLYRSLGYAPSRRVCEHGFLDLIAGRIYADPDRLVEMFCDGLPLGYDLAALRANPRLIDRSPSCFAPERTDALWLFRLPAILWTMRRAAQRLKREGPRAAERFEQQTLPAFRAYVERGLACDLRQLADHELMDVLDDRCLHVLDEFGAEFLRPGLFAGLAVTALETRLVKLLGPEDGGRCVRALVSGLETDAEVAPEAGLSRVAQGQCSLSEFLDRFGHRGPNELELAAPRWREVPDEAAGWAERLRASAVPDPAQLQARAADDRDRTTRLLPALLQAQGAGSFASLAVADAEAAQRLLPYRQKARHYWMTGYALIRDAIREIARRRGLDNEIFFLRLEEVRQFSSATDPWRDIIRQRQELWHWRQRLAVPDVVESTNLEAIGDWDMPSPAATSRLEGTALSPGTARGPVWIQAAARPAADLRTGCILVCPSLDPGLIPLMLAACAVVVERGGILSHGAIVARQVGLPVVVVPHATRLLRDGRIVIVDADQGCILCPAEDEP